jgi:hypothetical protein
MRICYALSKLLRRWSNLFALSLISCGGGGGDKLPPTHIPRTDLNYCYYGSLSYQLAEVFEHTTCYMVTYWEGEETLFAVASKAKSLGLDLILELPHAYLDNPETRIRGFFLRLQSLDLLSSVIAFYPIDEPDENIKNGDPTLVIREKNALIRRVMLEFPELANTKLGVIYASSNDFPGVETYDWVGFDDYDNGAEIFTNGQYQKLKDTLRPDQRIILVPGGASKWNQHPEAFKVKAQLDNQVILVMPFIWIDDADPKNGAFAGIRSNGLAPAYIEVGREIKNVRGP